MSSATHFFLGKIVLALDAIMGFILLLIFGGQEAYHRHGEIPKTGKISAVQFMRLRREETINAE